MSSTVKYKKIKGAQILLERSVSVVYFHNCGMILTAETSGKVLLQRGVSIPVALVVWGSRCWSLGHISLHCPGLFCVRLFRPSQTENPLTDRKHGVITYYVDLLVAEVLILTKEPFIKVIHDLTCFLPITSVMDALSWPKPSTDQQRPPRGRGGLRSLAAARSRPVCWCHRADTCSVSQQSPSCFCTGQNPADQTVCRPILTSSSGSFHSLIKCYCLILLKQSCISFTHEGKWLQNN